MKPTTIELTSKPIKAALALSYVALIVGLMMMFGGDAQTGLVGAWMGVFGLTGVIVSRVARWWENG